MSAPFKAAITANWTLIASSAAEIDAQVSARRHADIDAAEQALAKAKELTLHWKTTLGDVRRTTAPAERAA